MLDPISFGSEATLELYYPASSGPVMPMSDLTALDPALLDPISLMSDPKGLDLILVVLDHALYICNVGSSQAGSDVTDALLHRV